MPVDMLRRDRVAVLTLNRPDALNALSVEMLSPRRWSTLALEGDLQGHLARELDAFALAFTTEDQREGMAAFFETRPPTFVGR